MTDPFILQTHHLPLYVLRHFNAARSLELKMASNKVYRERIKVTPENVTCPYYKQTVEPDLLFPVFTRDLYFSVFPAPIPDRRINDGNPTDHTAILKVLAQLGSGKIGKHFTAMRKDFTKYSCSKPLKRDLSMVVMLTEMDSKAVDYIDAVRVIEPFLLRKHPNPFLCRVMLNFRDCVPFQVERYYCVSEYWHEGASLCNMVQQSGRMHEDDARFYLSELTCAIEDVHERGKIFRCLSLCMLRLDPNGHLKVCPYTTCEQNLDCGKPCDPISRNCGDQFYASPEVVFGVDVKPVADWWSFGAIMYHLLTGQTPFSGCTLGELGKAITEEDPPYLPDLSSDAVDLMQLLLHKDPRRRAGWGDGGICTVKNHPFWSTINWMSVPQRYLKPPFAPAQKKPMFGLPSAS
ncbi:protein kinase C [Elysia marginata]|uniref:Protein kinase C n=1 Tax=Elysia marginata TaxID=1093978 RepID=A0AAV4FYG2_9GAST|nr:protein kinase C [Elysia marginata]